MKKLKKILLINWLYFSKQLIEVDDINFLTGKNGAGKSTVIDALQIVLLGETNSRNFNQAANEKSQRTLDGYLRADMDENSPYSRRGKDFSSYIACEFFDETEGTSFVTGVVFDCRSDGTRQERFFIYDGVIPENCFLENQEAMDISRLRRYLKELYGTGAELYDTQKQYRVNMVAKWNVQNEQVCRMLKKAVSFRPIVDIQKFITENICDIPNKPDIEAMQQNIRDYKRHEQLAQRQEEKLAALREIGRLYRDWQAAITRWQEHRFLAAWAEKEDCRANIDKCELEKADCSEKASKAEAAEAEASAAITEKRKRKEELSIAQKQSDIYREQEKLSSQKENLEKEQQRLSSDLQKEAVNIRREAVSLCTLCEKTEQWPSLEPISSVIETADAVRKAFSPFSACDHTLFSRPLALFEKAQTAAGDFAGAVRNAAYQMGTRLDGLKEEKAQKEKILSDLHRNIKDYPKGLLSLKERLCAELQRQTARPVSIDILADVLEIPEAEEMWRNVVEGYLHTQKFYLLVDPSYYEQAVSVYNRVKRKYGDQSFGLVDIEKIREKETLVPRDDSLAQKVDTQNALARTYIDYLLGRVVCCSQVEQLREHKTAVTSDGMLYQGYVMRSILRKCMEDVFIGRRAVALRIERLRSELDAVNKEIDTWNPISEQLNEWENREYIFSQHFIENTVTQRQAEYLRGLEISQELAEMEERLSRLDLTWLMQIDNEIHTLEMEINSLEESKGQLLVEQGQLKEKIRKFDHETLPDLRQRFHNIEIEIREEFTQTFVNDVGLPRYQQELKRLKKAAVVAKNFGDRLQQTVNERNAAQNKLFSKRADYVRDFQPCAFRCNAMDNDEFAEEMRLLEESELPKYRQKIQAARESAMEQFQNDFLAKLKSSIEQVQDQVKKLNKALKQAQFGTDRYQFRVDRSPDYAEYYDMIMAPELMEGEAGLFALPFQQKYGKLVEDLFSRLAASDDTQLNARKQSELKENIERYTDFRTYLKFDLETTDQNGSKQLLSQTLNTKSAAKPRRPSILPCWPPLHSCIR